MGIILSRVRKKKSAVETLEKLDKDIKEIEENGLNAQRKYKKITKLLLIYSVGLYVLCGIIFYFQFTSTIQGKLLYLVPLAISPLLLYIIRRIISWYFDRLLDKNQKRLNEMKEEKKKILDEVMDKETYKVAKQILEKFSVEAAPKTNYNAQLVHPGNIDGGVRKRMITSTNAPRPKSPGVWNNNPTPRPITSHAVLNRPMPGPGIPTLQLPAPIIPLNRSYVDKIVEYLIGDGPNNRYALICSQCHSHNGMALREEFEYIGFICCYCRFFNPARKVKPEAPKLEVSFQQESESDSDKTSGENSDAEHKEASDEKPQNIEENCQTVDNSKADVSCINTLTDEALQDESNTDKLIEESPAGESNIEEPEVYKNSTEEHVSSQHPESDANCDESVVKS